MKKIKVDSLLKEEIRAIVPFKTNEGKDEKIVIYNPSESLKQEVINMFYVGIDNPEKKVSENEIIKNLELLFGSVCAVYGPPPKLMKIEKFREHFEQLMASFKK